MRSNLWWIAGIGFLLCACAGAEAQRVECRPQEPGPVGTVDEAYAAAMRFLACQHRGLQAHPGCYTLRRYAQNLRYQQGVDDPPWTFELFRETPTDRCGQGGTTVEREALYQVDQNGRVEEIPYP